MTNSTNRKAASSTLTRVAIIGAAVLSVGCDTDVVNPGPVQAEFLDRPEAHGAIVKGIGRATAQALNWIGYTGAAVVREIHPSGATGGFGITIRWQRGELDPTDDALDTHWEQAQRARFLGEDGIRIIEASDPADIDNEVLSEGYLWTGYANRILGEHFCDAVIDGGNPQAHTIYFDRALGQFDQAVTLATGDMRNAAIAGRASIRLNQGDFAGAAADAATVAAAVSPGWSFDMPYHGDKDEGQYNRIQFSALGQPYRAHTVWNTRFEAFGLSTNNPGGDPRVPFLVQNEVGDGAIDCCGQVPWWPQQKYTERGDDVQLSSYEEMQLIRAEAALAVDSDIGAAMGFINGLRANAGLGALTANTMDEAWTHLKSERGIELWLEGRRYGDRRRWTAQSAPGAFDALETIAADAGSVAGSHLAQQDLCFPTPPSEQDTNPNVPIS